jgi:hypothetical protein
MAVVHSTVVMVVSALFYVGARSWTHRFALFSALAYPPLLLTCAAVFNAHFPRLGTPQGTQLIVYGSSSCLHSDGGFCFAVVIAH